MAEPITVGARGANEDVAIHEIRDLMRWAREHFGVRAAAVTLNERDRVGVLAVSGADAEQVPDLLTRSGVACSSPSSSGAVRPISDAPLMVCGGVPFVSHSGESMGGVYVYDTAPHRLDVTDMAVLKQLAELVQQRMRDAGLDGRRTG